MILRNLRTDMENVINKSHISIDGVYFVMKDIMNEITEIYNQEVQNEQERKLAEITKEQEKNGLVQQEENIDKIATLDPENPGFNEAFEEVEEKDENGKN